ncbi:Bile salt-activated lipase [Cytospora mali]|uniref:Carboxylic ester hydrolase n=1 Tax=Cytospora mali TaxID=578113 RepID=A0A194UZ80_CYTMA|nr:Bile salt-activated lipase [Valsa mali var. pyri (nom. inval.)]
MALYRPSWAIALWASLAASAPSPQSINSDLTILLNNKLQDAVSGCHALSEQLWSPEQGTGGIRENLDYLIHEGKTTDDTQFWITAQGNNTRAVSVSGGVLPVQPDVKLPVLCTQSAPFVNASYTDASTKWQVSVHSNGHAAMITAKNCIRFRDRTSFRFYGIRYAPEPQRFTYPVPYTGSNGTESAISFGESCVQGSTLGSEDCLFLNIWTPYLPNPRDINHNANLKPVMFWIHGGAFTSGTGSDSTFDGGSVASRGDVVLVTINYRLSTLGFLALNDGVTNGNFGLADQIAALDWVRAHIQDFGGDPDRITIFGQSAGAGSVRAIMASPKGVGKFAAAIPMSNLGGLNYGTTYSEYYTVEQEVKVAANDILNATDCTGAASQVDCLRAIPAHTLTSLSTVARYVVVDGTYITTENLTLTGPEAPYKLMMGTMREDGAALLSYPTTTNETAYLAASGWDIPQPTLDSLFPIPDGTNQTLDLFNASSRLATDGVFRCADEATVYSGLQNGKYDSVYYYEFERSYQMAGYPGISVCQPLITSSHPYGDPSLPYFRCHSGELYLVFGNLAFQGLPERDEYDLSFEQFALDSFTSFARTYDPNPDEGFLNARGYSNTSKEIEQAGVWKPAKKGDLTMRALGWPSYQDSFREEPQCNGIGVPLTYWQ